MAPQVPAAPDAIRSGFRQHHEEVIMSTTTTSGPAGTPAPGTSDPLNALLAQNWWAVALRGVLGIVFGLIALILPGAAMLSLVLVFAAYMLADGVLGIISAVRAARRKERWGWLTFEGFASIAAGVVLMLWPGLTVLAFVVVVAAWAIVSGALMVAAAFQLDNGHGRWWLALGGAVSVALGVLMILAPLVGAVVLAWWIGAYALVFGAALLVLAFKLRARHGEERANPTLAAATR
jgi:uncharacterized membrane protein HdeD (DUF308 family)